MAINVLVYLTDSLTDYEKTVTRCVYTVFFCHFVFITSNFSAYNVHYCYRKNSEVTFTKHIENLCGKTNKKLHALARIANFMNFEKRCLVIKTFVFFPNLIIAFLYGRVTARRFYLTGDMTNLY